jgi:adenylate cyclase
MKKNLYLFVPLLAVFFSSFLNFTSLDDKVFDLFLRTIPSLEENDSVLVIKVDDLAIENVGLFPWTRDILADAIVFLREMGAETVVFDLSYLDKSPLKVDPEYLNEQLPEYLDYGFRRINETVSQVMDAVESGSISRAEAGIYRQQMIDFNRSVQDSLGTSISYVTRDVDEYFGDTLRFFGNSYLTLTMVSDNDIIGEEKVFDMSPYNPDWLAENI